MQSAACVSSQAPTPERCPGSTGSSSLGSVLLVLHLPHHDNTPAGAPRETCKKHTQHLYFQPTPIMLSSPSTHRSCSTLQSADHWGLPSHTCKDTASFSLLTRSQGSALLPLSCIAWCKTPPRFAEAAGNPSPPQTAAHEVL